MDLVYTIDAIFMARLRTAILTVSYSQFYILAAYSCLFISQEILLERPIKMSYKAGIIKAIEELKDRTGSSMISIKKHMQANMPADKKWMNAMFLKALKDGVKAGDFTQAKGSYKLSADYKKKVAAAAKPKKAPKKVSCSYLACLEW